MILAFEMVSCEPSSRDHSHEISNPIKMKKNIFESSLVHLKVQIITAADIQIF